MSVVKTILILAANPTSTSRLRLDEEVRQIDEGLRRANKREMFKLEQKWAVQQRDFYRAILDYQPHFIHFCGHSAGVDGIVLEDEAGQATFMQADVLGKMFQLFAKKGVECVLLNACYSEVQAISISQHINYVIGMNQAVGDRAAINFAVAFYDALGAGEDIEFAFELGRSQLVDLKEYQTPVLNKRLINSVDQAIQIYQEIAQKNQKTISSANLISEPPKIKKKQWQGRQQEIKQLKEWLQEEEVTIIGIQGLSGVGKSWLSAYLYEDEQIKTSFEKMFWADVSKSPNFIVFAQNCLIYWNEKTPETLQTMGESEPLINELLKSLKNSRCLLVIDNLETLLDENRQIYQQDYKNFFSNWVNRGTTSTLLLTTQVQPEILEGETNWLFLQGLESEDGERLLRSLGIVGTDAQLQNFSRCLNGHPKMLSLVATLLKSGTHIREAEKLGLNQLDALLNENLFPYRELGKVQFVLILEQHWQLLTPQLKRFFANLSIYRRSFNRDAASVMLTEADRTVTPLQTQLALRELTSRSLLEDNIEGEPKYHFHPFVLEYAKQKVGQQQDVLREKAIAYYQSMATDKSTWKTLEDLAPYLEIFYQRCEQKHYGQAFDTLSICDEFLVKNGYHFTRAELYEHLVQAWLGEVSDAEKVTLADAFFRNGVACYYLGHYSKTIEHCQQSLLMAREMGDCRVEANALCWIGRAYHRQRQPQQAIEFNQLSLKIAREIGDAELVAQVLINLGNNFRLLKQYEEAIEFCQQGLDVSKASGNLSKLASAQDSLGNIYFEQEQYAIALDCYQQSMQTRQQTVNRVGEAYCLGRMGNVYYIMKQYQPALEYYQQSLEISREIGYSHGEVVAIGGLGSAYRALGQNQQALECYQQLLKIKREVGDSQGEAEALQQLQEIERELSGTTFFE